MYYTYGYKDKIKIEDKYTNGVCPNCGHTEDKYLADMYRVFNFCFIPVWKKSLKKGLMCSCCGNIEPMDKKEYKAAKASLKQ